MKSEKAFLFSLHNAEGLPPFKMRIKANHTTRAGKTGPEMPWFGFGWNTSELTFGKINSHSSPGYVYQLPEGFTYHSYRARNLFAGSFEFIPDDFEVFYNHGR